MFLPCRFAASLRGPALPLQDVTTAGRLHTVFGRVCPRLCLSHRRISRAVRNPRVVADLAPRCTADITPKSLLPQPAAEARREYADAAHASVRLTPSPRLNHPIRNGRRSRCRTTDDEY